MRRLLPFLALALFAVPAAAKEDVLHVSGGFMYDHPKNFKFAALGAGIDGDSAGYIGFEAQLLRWLAAPTLATGEQQRAIGVRAGLLFPIEVVGIGAGFTVEGLATGLPSVGSDVTQRVLGAIGGELALAANLEVVSIFVAAGSQRITDDNSRRYLEVQFGIPVGSRGDIGFAFSAGLTYAQYTFGGKELSSMNFMIGGLPLKF